MQRVAALAKERVVYLDLPDPDEEVMPAVRWGHFEHTLTPAFWAAQAWMDPSFGASNFALGRSLAEELVACLLGGHGAPAEVGLAAFRRVIDYLDNDGPDLPAERALELLSRPLLVGGRQVRYRFAGQRSRYLAGSLRELAEIDETALTDVQLRDRLCLLPGVGPKTASWIVRNHRGSDEVAILDVHIIRACTIMGVFEQGASPARGYRDLENRFLGFCKSIGVRAALMDGVMWRTMRTVHPRLINLLLQPTNPPHNSSSAKRGETNVRWGARYRQG